VVVVGGKLRWLEEMVVGGCGHDKP